MRPSEQTFLIGFTSVVISLWLGSVHSEMQHFGELDYDKTISCEATVLGKRVLWFALRTEQVKPRKDYDSRSTGTIQVAT